MSSVSTWALWEGAGSPWWSFCTAGGFQGSLGRGHGAPSLWEVWESRCWSWLGEERGTAPAPSSLSPSTTARGPCPSPGGDTLFLLSQEDVFIQQTQDTKNPVIYAVFSASG